jgi:hypothetical protein
MAFILLFSIFLSNGLPELIITSSGLFSDAEFSRPLQNTIPLSNMYISGEVFNLGDDASRTASLSVFFSPNDVFNMWTATEVERVEIPELAPDDSVSLGFNTTLPDGFFGVTYVFLYVDVRFFFA